MKKTTQVQAGRSMVEMLGVLAIVGVLSVAGIAGYSMAMNKYKVSRVMDEIQLLGTNIRTLYATQGTYMDISPKLLYQVRVMDSTQCPKTTIDCSIKGVNPFGGDLTIQAEAANGLPNSAFSIGYTNIPSNACVSLATTQWGGTSSGMVELDVNGTVVLAQLLPFSIAAANAACNQPAGNTLKWVMR
jgi:Tfp pilus assembly protein PilE